MPYHKNDSIGSSNFIVSSVISLVTLSQKQTLNAKHRTAMTDRLVGCNLFSVIVRHARGECYVPTAGPQIFRLTFAVLGCF